MYYLFICGVSCLAFFLYHNFRIGGGTMINISNKTFNVPLNIVAKISLCTPSTVPFLDSAQTFTVENPDVQDLRLRTYLPWRCTRLDDNERPFVYFTRRFVKSSLVDGKEMINAKAAFSKGCKQWK